MRRRVYVSTLVAALAGCMQRGGEGDETTTGAELTSEPTSTATAQSTESETPTGTSTPSDPLVRFEAALNEAVDRYVPSGVSFENVNGSHTEVSASAVREPLERAETLMESLESDELSDDRETKFEKLSGVFWFLWWVTEAHDNFVKAWERHQTAWEQILANDSGISDSLSAIDDAIDDAEVALNRLLRDSDESDVSAFPGVLDSDYEAKRQQISSEIEAFRTLSEEFGNFRSAFDEAERGMQSYDSAHFDSASIYFDNAESDFETLASNFRPYQWSSTFETTANEAACVASAMSDGCDRMEAIAQAVGDGDEDNPDAAKDTAQSRFHSCETVAQDVVVVEDFFS